MKAGESECGKLHTRIAQLVQRNNQLGAELECALGDLATAKGIIARLQKDADRYQWLRSPAVGPHIIGTYFFETISDDCNPPYRGMKIDKDLDEAIDLCMRDISK